MPSEEVLGKISKFGVQIRISDYNVARERTKRLEQKCNEMNIPCRVFEFASTTGSWYDLGGIGTPREGDDATVDKRYWRCQFNGCLTLEHGELTYCSRATNSYLIQGFERKEKDYFVLSDKGQSEEALKNFLLNRHFMEACRYCNGTDEERTIPPAIQLNSDFTRAVR